MKFLIIRFESIGDIVLTTPVVRCLKIQLANVEIHYLVKLQFKTVIQHNPYISKIHVLQNDWNKMIEELKLEKFDYIIDLHHDPRSLRVKKALNVPAFSFNNLNFEKFIFVKLKWNVMPDLHIIDRYMRTVEFFGVYNDGVGMEYFVSPDEVLQQKDIPTSHHLGYIAIVIGASFYTKKLPVYKLQELCTQIKHPIILVGGKEEMIQGEEISKIDPIKVYNACGKFSLNESVDLIRQSRVVITHDTGLMHVAAALKKPVISIWGSTTPSFGMVPYYGKNYLEKRPNSYDNVEVHKLWCRPCTKIGRHTCPQGHFKCMKNIATDEIVQNVNKRLKALK